MNSRHFYTTQCFSTIQINIKIRVIASRFDYQDGYSLRQSDHLSIKGDGQGGGWLELGHAGPATAGWYQCTAYNSAGSCATRARVIVDLQPEKPKEKANLPLNLPYPSRIIEPEYASLHFNNKNL